MDITIKLTKRQMEVYQHIKKYDFATNISYPLCVLRALEIKRLIQEGNSMYNPQTGKMMYSFILKRDNRMNKMVYKVKLK